MKGTHKTSNHHAPLILGTVQLGRNYGIANRTGVPAQKTALSILTAATDAGINIFDTAPNYGESEKLLGLFLKSRPSPEPWLVTKIVSGAASGIKSSTDLYALLKNSLLGSIKDLGCQRPPGLILQNAADAIDNPRVVDCLLKLKSEGLAGEVGFSIYQEKDIDFFLRHEGLKLIQAPFNLFDNRLIGYLADLNGRGSTVWARSIFLQGLFFLNPKKLPQAVSAAAPYLENLGRLSKEMDLSIEKMAFLYARDTLGLDGLVIGVETIGQLKKNLALDKLPSLDHDLRRRIEEEFTDVPEIVYNPVLWRTWS